ncbi:hypothetical protein [Streptomyces sp. NBC_00838]|uniref:hypothetical protein n=1 Tax=Streptomyces sp. NBC_00838 TaxID=2903680 RepID=UPI0038691084
MTACTDVDDGGSRGRASAAAVRAAKTLRVKSAGASRELLRQYDAVLERHPDQATRLTPLRGAVARHVTALSPPRPPEKENGSAKPSPSRPASSAPSTAPSSAPSLGTAAGDAGGGASGPAASVPADPGAAIKALAAAERRTSDAHADALVHAPPELARLLASLAASAAAHAYLLTEGFSS